MRSFLPAERIEQECVMENKGGSRRFRRKQRSAAGIPDPPTESPARNGRERDFGPSTWAIRRPDLLYQTMIQSYN